VGCVVLSMKGWLPYSPNIVKCRPWRHSANPLVKVLPLVNWDLLVRPSHIFLRTSSLLWGVLCRHLRLSALPGEGVGLVLLSQVLGMVGVGRGVLALEAALVFGLGCPLNLGLGVDPGIGPNLYPSIPWWRHTTGHALTAT
jgi:hypothetical protein